MEKLKNIKSIIRNRKIDKRLKQHNKKDCNRFSCSENRCPNFCGKCKNGKCSSKNVRDSIVGSFSIGGRKIRTGPRGGKYYIKKGKKIYIK